MRVLYFLEDRRQELFIKSLVKRIASDLTIPKESIIPDVRSARHGSVAIKEFKKFLKDYAVGGQDPVDIIVVAIDGIAIDTRIV